MENKKIILWFLLVIVVIVITIMIISSSEKIIEVIKYNDKLEKISSDELEIERKWIINEKDIPYDLSKTKSMKIEQTYICFSPEIRVRKINDGEYYAFTVKTNMTEDGLIRNELDENITEEEYNVLIGKKEGKTIYKTRYQFLVEDNIYAIDIFGGELEGLAYLEIEFASKKEADDFVTPNWVIKEVTNDIRYKNGFLARYGMPSK